MRGGEERVRGVRGWGRRRLGCTLVRGGETYINYATTSYRPVLDKLVMVQHDMLYAW